MSSVLGQQVARRRKELGLSQAKLAARMGMHQAMVSHIERGTRLQDLETTLATLATALETTPAALIEVYSATQ